MLQFLHVIKDATPNQAYEVFRAINSGKFAGIAYNLNQLKDFNRYMEIWHHIVLMVKTLKISQL